MMPRGVGTGCDDTWVNSEGAFLIELGIIGCCGLLHVCWSSCGVVGIGLAFVTGFGTGLALFVLLWHD